MKILAWFFLASVAFAQNWQPNVSNARFESRASSGELGSDIRSVSGTWFGYAVKTTSADHNSCCWDNSNQCGCHLEGGRVTVSNNSHSNVPVQLEGSDAVAILFRVSNNTVEKVRVYSLLPPRCWWAPVRVADKRSNEGQSCLFTEPRLDERFGSRPR